MEATAAAPMLDAANEQLVHLGGARAAPHEQRTVGALLVDAQCRAINLAAAAIGVVVAKPLMALIALAVRLSSPGPILYMQQRVGIDQRGGTDRRRPLPRTVGDRRVRDLGGRIFTIYKFRTMAARSEQAAQIWASRDDPRVTKVGSVLRKYRLDELPQLYNVLLGDMNVVGPRPEQPEIFARLRPTVDGYVHRQRVLPGITGLAQVSNGYDESIDDVKRKVAYDLEYIGSRSPIEDLRIMALTLPVMVGRRGAL